MQKSVVTGDVAELFKHARVSVIKIGADYIPDFDPGLLDQTLAHLNELMRGRETMPLDELRWRLDRSRPKCIGGYDGTDVVLIAIQLSTGPYGLLFEYPHDDIVVWRGHMYDRQEDGRLVLWVDPETGES
jgi:hypothetical protein